MSNAFRQLASVDKLLGQQRIEELKAILPHDVIVAVIRQDLDKHRLSISQGKKPPTTDEIVEEVCRKAQALINPSLRPVINATGVVLHTNMGRSPLSEEAIAGMNLVSSGYDNVEFDLESGKRGSRQVHLESILCQLTGAEAALVVNNCASAVLLALTALAKKKEVVISRSQAVEIGGGFRIPEVMRQSGARLMEVGTTNCTYSSDYEQAITPRTAALLRVHSSNFKVVGFTHAVTLEEMVAISKQHDIPVFDDLGSGCLLDTSQFGLDPEPMVQESVRLGVQLAFFSGDKLLGGPQAGIIVGRQELVDKLRKHALSRALRIDRIRMAGLAVTLLHYLKGEMLNKIPIWRMISMPIREIESRAADWARPLGQLAQVMDGESLIGGGSLPGGTLPTKLVAVKGTIRNTSQALAKRLRSQDTPVIGRISGNVLLLDPRSVLPEQDNVVIQTLGNLADTLRI